MGVLNRPNWVYNSKRAEWMLVVVGILLGHERIIRNKNDCPLLLLRLGYGRAAAAAATECFIHSFILCVVNERGMVLRLTGTVNHDSVERM